jgi:hypothetical protein
VCAPCKAIVDTAPPAVGYRGVCVYIEGLAVGFGKLLRHVLVRPDVTNVVGGVCDPSRGACDTTIFHNVCADDWAGQGEDTESSVFDVG